MHHFRKCSILQQIEGAQKVKKQEQRETHTNVNENKLSRSIIKTALVWIRGQNCCTKVCGYYMLQTNRIRYSHTASC